ncbi:WGxxGxxG family protein [Paenibacillus sp. NEAU-GSW1]|uniref:WGxxGxxG family protein n=1 Tax=Paenibacillus sp. NEAU-GSW1 TaxID=2682486 RepID=UPI0012E1BE69|nr:WGxxGxxG family protein [Paenibacillus sp. NEAU-GSW1]MUT67761.1 hypothetical protein [Paenibacillus sp. NEAU-GSW1]
MIKKKAGLLLTAVCLSLSLSSAAYANQGVANRTEPTPFADSQYRGTGTYNNGTYYNGNTYNGTFRGAGAPNNNMGILPTGTDRTTRDGYGAQSYNNRSVGLTDKANRYRTTAADDNDMDWGWLGLLGLIGLAGLRNRGRERT